MPEVDSNNPDVKAVLDQSGTKCVYAAVKQGAQRGVFENIAECVYYCVRISKF